MSRGVLRRRDDELDEEKEDMMEPSTSEKCMESTSKSSLSAGCSPALSRRFVFGGCVAPSTDSSYHLAQSVEHIHMVQMSPKTKRHRLWKLLATITPTRRAKTMTSLDDDVYQPTFMDRVDTVDDSSTIPPKLVAPDTGHSDVNYVTLLLKIRLKEGQNLAVRDASGSSDPYVKFRYKDKIVYKSNTVFKCLNPVWEEEFQMLADDMSTPIMLEVYDYDRFCTDDFMGGASVDISHVRWFVPFEATIELEDESNKTEKLGSISLSITIIPQTPQEKDSFLQKASRGIVTESQKKREKLVQMWDSVVNIVLVEGKGLSVNYNMTIPPEPYCKFKLGCEKYKSKVCNRTFDPKWIEQFDLHIYDKSTECLEVMVHDKKTNNPIGKTQIDLTQLPRDQTVQKWYPLDECSGSVLLLLTVSGSQSTDSVVDLTEFNQNDVRHAIIEKYGLSNTLKNPKDIGSLTVKVFRGEDLQAKDIGGKSDPFAVLELVNTRLQTHTEYKTLNPQWNKLFTFGVKDIHTCLEVTVYDEDPNNKFEFMGKVAIPLITIRNCERRWYGLKDKKLQNRVKGEILLELDVIWNPVRAAIRTFNPREKKYIEQDPKFKAGVFRSTVMELKEFGMSVVESKNYVQSCFNWESTPRSITAFILFMLCVYYIQLWHAPLFLLALFARCLLYRRVSESLQRHSPKEDEEMEDEKNSFFNSNNKNTSTSTSGKKKEEATSSLRDTLSSVQETLGVVQNLLIFIVQLLQRIKNTFNFTNPWLSWLAITVLSIATLLLYLVPLRTLVMIWGVNKFTKKLRNPHFIDNNELLDFLSRVPTDVELVKYRPTAIRSGHATDIT